MFSGSLECCFFPLAQEGDSPPRGGEEGEGGSPKAEEWIGGEARCTTSGAVDGSKHTIRSNP